MSEKKINNEYKNNCEKDVAGTEISDANLLTEAVNADKKEHRFYIPAEDAPFEEREAFLRALGVPASADEYKIEIKDKLISSDPEVNEKLRKLGFTQKQVQAVYDLAVERVLPCVYELARDYEGNRQLARLAQHFGGEERFSEVARQLSAWGTKNLPKTVYEPLASTYEGVIALYNMMNSGEPVLGGTQAPSEMDTEETLKQVMMSEKYWRDKEPKTLKRVKEGFERLYPAV